MSRMPGTLFLVLSLAGAACSPVSLFPAEVTKGIEKDFDFSAWRNMPNAKVGQKVQLGGRIVQVNGGNGSLIIIATQLPIVQQPAYGPKDSGRRSGEFSIVYPGSLDSKWVRAGNRLIAVGTTKDSKTVVVDDVQRSLPSLTAHCLHIWNTGGKEIAEFPYNAGGGYEPLEEETHCAPH